MKKYMSIIKHMLKIVHKSYSKSYYLVVITSLMLAGAYVLRANIEKNLFDGTRLFILDTSLDNRYNVLVQFATFVLIYIITQVIVHVSNYIEEILEFKMKNKLSKEICLKTSHLSAECFEDSIFLDQLEKAEKGKDDAINILLCTTALVTYYIPYLILMSIWLWHQSEMLVITILIAFLPTVISYAMQINMYSKNEDDVAPLRRKSKSYEESMIGKSKGKETRINGGHRFFMKKYLDALNQIYTFDMKVTNKRQRLNMLLKVVQAFSFVSIIGISIYLAAKGEISIGTFAAVFTSIDILYSNLNEAVSRQYASISESFATVENYYDFIENDTYAKANNRRGLIKSVHNLSYRYPNSDFDSLRNVSFEINAGETIAVVGENGAGKSTLAKLLLGIYTPTSGHICTTEDENCEYTAVFQNYMRYSMSLSDNISLSGKEKTLKPSEIDALLSKVGLNISQDKFDKGKNTVLGNEFGGIELSGGEWQKLSIARGIYKDYDFIVFDEPTASIDPIEESNIIKLIHELTEDKTSFIITHRMATVKHADKILVLKKGELVEVGNHEDLLKVDSEYKRLYETQKNNYVYNCDSESAIS